MPMRIELAEPGGPEKMQWVEAQIGAPGPGEVRLTHKAVGLNFIDVYHRTGLYPLPAPFSIGMEAAGIVEAVGDGVTHLSVGDRVAYAAAPPGSYAEARVMPAQNVCRLPETISFETGAAMMLQGLTVQYLFRRTWPLSAGDKVLFHAAAGGVGLIACQWARAMGVELIGTAGTDEKCQMAAEHGATHVINYRTQDWVAQVRELTGGAGVKMVMDGVGADTWDGSLDCLAPFGLMCSFGAASGPVPPVNIATLGQKGSLFVTRPTLFTHITSRAVTQAMADDLFEMVGSGKVKIAIGRSWPLAEAAEAHRALEARATTGSTILTV